jgi:rfaE bifunctional protein kinase chain/domain/rfaE bifunctional protein nucleotidyltransferase chain/domain
MEFSSDHYTKKLLTLESAVNILNGLRASGKTIALCHGVFDLIHPGHIQHFGVAKKTADVLIVSITADKFVNKGPGRPLFDQDVRLSSLAAFLDIDFVTISYSATALDVIDLIKPDFYIKGSDYANDSDDVTGMISLERKAVEKNGGRIHFTNELTSSSSLLINRFFSKLPEEAQSWLECFRKDFGIDQILGWLDQISKLRVLILGETIIDRYTYCEPLAKSSKDPILAFHKLESHSYMGGVVAIANNCSGWAEKVALLSAIGLSDPETNELVKTISSNIELDFIELTDRPTILKHRFVDKTSSGRVFEYYDFENSSLRSDDSSRILDQLKTRLTAADIVIAADYGHSFFSKDLINHLDRSTKFFAVNTQANAGNRGYNTISKYKRADFLSLNGGELQLELRDRSPDYNKIVPEIMKQMNSKVAVLTLGAEGLLVFGKQSESAHIPAFASKVVDKVGAGDAVLSISSLLAKVGAPLEVIGFFANLVAAHEVSQLGHQVSLSISDLKKHTKSILG